MIDTRSLGEGIFVDPTSFMLLSDGSSSQRCIVKFKYDAKISGRIAVRVLHRNEKIIVERGKTYEEAVERGSSEIKALLCLPLYKPGEKETKYFVVVETRVKEPHADSIESTMTYIEFSKEGSTIRPNPIFQSVTKEGIEVESYKFGRESDDIHDPDGVGRFTVFRDEFGKGNNGVKVCDGVFHTRQVAVKCIPHLLDEKARLMIQDRVKSDNHPSLVKVYGLECDEYRNTYVAVDRCSTTLEKLVNNLKGSSCHASVGGSRVDFFKIRSTINPDVSEYNPSVDLINILRGLAEGVSYLHKHGVYHFDLKPSNILLHVDQSTITAKIYSIRFADLLANDKNKKVMVDEGWHPREVIHGNMKRTAAVDCFAIGCIIGFFLSRGRHMFGPLKDRVHNIKYHSRSNNLIDYTDIKNMHEAKDLINLLLDDDPNQRLNVDEIPKHIFFWGPKKRLDFITAVSDFLQVNNTTQVYLNIRDAAKYKGFKQKLEQVIQDEIDHGTLGKYNQYQKDNGVQLARLIRNLHSHYQGQTPAVQTVFGMNPLGIDEYFTTLFPKFTFYVYQEVKSNNLTGDFASYF